MFTRSHVSMILLGVFLLTSPAFAGEDTQSIPGYRQGREFTVDGNRVWLCLPESSPEPIPLVVWSGGAGSRGYDTRAATLLVEAFSKGDFHPAVMTAEYGNHISPAADGGAGLLAAVDYASENYKTSRRIMLAGFSRGGQFTHRFVLHAAPDRVLAAVPCNPGAWTLPEGGALVRNRKTKEMGTLPAEAKRTGDEKAYTDDAWKASLAPGVQAASSVPFLVICTRDDTTRLPLAKAWVKASTAAGYTVQSDFSIKGGHRVTGELIARVVDFLTNIHADSKRAVAPPEPKSTEGE